MINSSVSCNLEDKNIILLDSEFQPQNELLGALDKFVAIDFVNSGKIVPSIHSISLRSSTTLPKLPLQEDFKNAKN